MSTAPFQEIGLPLQDIESNFVWRKIKEVYDVSEGKTDLDAGQNKLVVDGSSQVVDPTVTDIASFGVDSTVSAGTAEIVKLGNRIDSLNSQSNILIGGEVDPNRSVIQNASDGNIQVGLRANLGGAGGANESVGNSILLGHQMNIVEDDRNVIIGHGGVSGSGDDRIAILNRPVTNNPAPGTVTLGGGFDSSAVGKFQLLSADMVNLTNPDGVSAYDSNVGTNVPAAQATHGWLRLKYKNKTIKVPILVDDDLVGPGLPP
jgi:hypothetical protein